MWWGILSLICVLIQFGKPNMSLIYFCISKIFKLTFKTEDYEFTNKFLNLCLMNSQRLFYRQTTGIKSLWLTERFKIVLLFKKKRLN